MYWAEMGNENDISNCRYIDAFKMLQILHGLERKISYPPEEILTKDSGVVKTTIDHIRQGLKEEVRDKVRVAEINGRVVGVVVPLEYESGQYILPMLKRGKSTADAIKVMVGEKEDCILISYFRLMLMICGLTSPRIDFRDSCSILVCDEDDERTVRQHQPMAYKLPEYIRGGLLFKGGNMERFKSIFDSWSLEEYVVVIKFSKKTIPHCEDTGMEIDQECVSVTYDGIYFYKRDMRSLMNYYMESMGMCEFTGDNKDISLH